MSLPTMFNVQSVNDLFFRQVKELSIRSLKDIREGNLRKELRLVRKSAFPGALL